MDPLSKTPSNSSSSSLHVTSIAQIASLAEGTTTNVSANSTGGDIEPEETAADNTVPKNAESTGTANVTKTLSQQVESTQSESQQPQPIFQKTSSQPTTVKTPNTLLGPATASVHPQQPSGIPTQQQNPQQQVVQSQQIVQQQPPYQREEHDDDFPAKSEIRKNWFFWPNSNPLTNPNATGSRLIPFPKLRSKDDKCRSIGEFHRAGASSSGKGGGSSNELGGNGSGNAKEIELDELNNDKGELQPGSTLETELNQLESNEKTTTAAILNMNLEDQPLVAVSSSSATANFDDPLNPAAGVIPSASAVGGSGGKGNTGVTNTGAASSSNNKKKPQRNTKQINTKEYRYIRELTNIQKNRKYSILGFLPHVLYDQFKMFLNAIYLALNVMMWLIPALKMAQMWSYYGPLIMVVGFTVLKEYFEDLKRRRKDNEVNSELYKKVDTKTGELVDVKSMDIRAGDFIILKSNQRAPADMVFLHTTSDSGQTYIRTDQLDGETDWKLRKPCQLTQKLLSNGDDEKKDNDKKDNSNSIIPKEVEPTSTTSSATSSSSCTTPTETPSQTPRGQEGLSTNRSLSRSPSKLLAIEESVKGPDYLAFALVVDFEIFRKCAIWGDCRRVQIAVFVRYKWLICFVILKCKISRFLVHFQRPKQNPVMVN